MSDVLALEKPVEEQVRANGQAVAQNAVFVGLPYYDQVVAEAFEGLLLATQLHRWKIQPKWCSILPHGFNALWCECMNSRAACGWTHHAMHHADLQAEPGWIDKGLQIMDKTGADVVSVVIPIKDHRGLSSTGWMDPETGRVTRFTMREVYGFPETFDASVACPGKWLMVNTGLWVCKLGPWVKKFPGFEFRTAIKWDENDVCGAVVLSEDWAFSEWCARNGLKVVATRAVKAVHHGKTTFHNDHPWGDWETDLGDSADPAEHIPGWMDRAELRWLRQQAAKAQRIVEIGCWHGRSTLALAESCPGTVFAVDDYRGVPGRWMQQKDGKLIPETEAEVSGGNEARDGFLKNLKAHLDSGKVIHSYLPSVQRAAVTKDGCTDFIFVDGDHSYEEVSADIKAWFPKVRSGGMLAGHDRHEPGVAKALKELLPDYKNAPGSIWYFTIPGD